MTPEQHWQLIAGLMGLVIVLIGYIWLRQHSWIRSHEARLKVIEEDHLKRSEFDGAMSALRSQMTENTKQLTEIETETRIRSEYVEKQLQRLEETQLRIEVSINKSFGRRKS